MGQPSKRWGKCQRKTKEAQVRLIRKLREAAEGLFKNSNGFQGQPVVARCRGNRAEGGRTFGRKWGFAGEDGRGDI